MQERVERTVVENTDTPCVENARCLLSCAAACAELGLDAEARRLEDATNALGMEGYELWLDPLRARLALVRGDLDALGGMIEGSHKWHWVTWNHVNGVATRLDALIASCVLFMWSGTRRPGAAAIGAETIASAR